MPGILILNLLGIHMFICYGLPTGDTTRMDKKGKDSLQNEFKFGKLKNMSVMDIISRVNVEKRLNLYEADIKLDPEFSNILRAYYANNGLKNPFYSLKSKRETKRNRRYIWRSRVVPYVISKELESYSEIIINAMKHITAESCISFKKRENEPNWILFVKKDGCWSSVGKMYWTKGAQEISLGDECLIVGTAVHEILHSLGFWHEQSRPDRDKYVEIFWENIEEGQEFNFDKFDHRVANTLGIRYDPSSVMHYGKYSFTKNNLPTIAAIDDPNKQLGQKEALSPLDVIQLNTLYDCANINNGEHWSSWSSYGPCSDYCFKERQRFCSSKDLRHCKGSDQYGIQSEYVKCKEDATECYAPVDGHWGRWSFWGACSVSCGVGVHSRKRVCNDPERKFGGKPCPGLGKSTRKCNMGSCGLGIDDCDFESDIFHFCKWTNMRNNPHFNWVRSKTRSLRTGPIGDHTTGNGHYIVVNGSSPAKMGNRAYLRSRLIEGTSEKCFTFFYHMYGSSMGALRLFLQLEKRGEIIPVWSKVGNQGNAWQEEKIPLERQESYRIIFEAIRGPGPLSNIALDDLSLSKGICGNGLPHQGVERFRASHNDKMKDELFTTRVKTNFQTFLKKEVHPITKAERVGCFKDKGEVKGRRPFPNYKNLRNIIDWNHIDVIVERCARIAKKSGAQYFAIQFYGECWYGTTKEVDYARDGKTNDCWKSVGKANTMMVYHWAS